ADGASPLLRVAGAAARVRVEHAVARTGVDLDLVEEARVVLRERAAVDREQHRVTARLVEAGRPHQPRVHLGPVGGDGLEALGLAELTAGDELVGDAGHPFAVPSEELVRAGGRARGVDEDTVREVIEPGRLLAADEQLRLVRTVGGRRVDVDVAAVLDPEGDTAAVPHRLADERVRGALAVERSGEDSPVAPVRAHDGDLAVVGIGAVLGLGPERDERAVRREGRLRRALARLRDPPGPGAFRIDLELVQRLYELGVPTVPSHRAEDDAAA